MTNLIKISVPDIKGYRAGSFQTTVGASSYTYTSISHGCGFIPAVTAFLSNDTYLWPITEPNLGTDVKSKFNDISGSIDVGDNELFITVTNDSLVSATLTVYFKIYGEPSSE